MKERKEDAEKKIREEMKQKMGKRISCQKRKGRKELNT